MSTSAGHTSIPETGEEDVVPEERKPKPDYGHHLLTPSLSPSLHPVTPDSDVGPHSPPSNRSQHTQAFDNEVTGFSNLSVADGKALATPYDLHGADVSSRGKAEGTPNSGMATGALDTGALATAGDTAGTNYGPNLGFPFPNVRPISGTASPAGHGMAIPPTPGASTPISWEGHDRIPPPKGSSPDHHSSSTSTRPARAPSASRPAGMEPKKSFLHRMFHHDDKHHKDKHGDAGLPKLDMPKGGFTPSGQPSPNPASRDSPPMTPGTPSVADSDGSRPPSRQSSFRGRKDGDIHAQMPQDGRATPSEGGSGLMRRLSHRSASHGSQSDEKKEKDKLNGMKPIALVGGAPVAVAKKEEAVGQSGNKFTLKDLIGMGGEGGAMKRRGSEKGSVKGSSTKGGSEHGGGDNGSTASLLKKYGVCDKAAIGKGATAVVRLAHKWDRREEKLYAVKEFRKRRKNETEKDYVKKLTSEFCISSTLHHPNIVETVDLVQDEQHHWCEVMEYCPGGDLYAAIKKGGMSSGEVECSFKQILLGISYLHNMGVAHRDIKPENLLLDGRGHVKITDFGVSDVFRMCWEKKTHLSKGLCGSEPYIAPELFDQKEYDARLVDVWAAAIVFYCMQFQELPWRVAKHSDSTFAAYIAAYAPNPNTIGGAAAAASGAPHPTPPPLNNLVPRECRTVIRHMLDPDPKTRWGIEEVLKDKWLAGIQVCKEGEVNDHTHVSAGLEVVKL